MKKMKSPASIIAGMVVVGALLCGNIVQAQSSIGGVYPNGTSLFQSSPTLTFTANSPAGVTNVTVALTVTSLQTGQSFLRNLTSANGLNISGPSTGLTVSTVLNSNTLYSAVIQVKDANGSVANQTVAFDTIAPIYTWEAEDYDYGGGLYINNPQTNAYAGLAASSGDAQNSNGNADYRPINPGLSTEGNGDTPRAPWIGTGKTDYDVGFTDGGDYGNYTRTFPAGTFNLYARVSGGNGPRAESADVVVMGGNVSIVSSGSGPYKFGTQGRGWQTYDFMPVTDNAGNLIQITFDGNPATLQVIQNQGSDNMNFFMLMPLNTNVVVSTVTVTNVTPNGSVLYNPAGSFSFNAFSPAAPVDANNILAQVTATNLWGQGSVSSLTASSGLTITGPSTNLSISFPTVTNTIYSVFIQIIDANGTPSSSTVNFDTVVPTYTWEAEDFDYSGGLYIDNPQTNAYSGLDGIAEVDFHCTQHGGDYNRIGLTTEGAGDKTRNQYNGTGYQDYDIGFNDGGNWGNYTRHYPAGTYNIYVRASNGGGGGSADSGSISLVTSGVGTTTQTLTQLGKWGVLPTGGWQVYNWIPVKDTAGNLARFTGGSLQTLRMTIDGGSCNENFFLLIPVDPNSAPKPYVDTFLPDGSSLFGVTNTLSFVVHSQPGTATSNIALNLNGVNVSGLTFSGSPNVRNVSYPIKTNMLYTAIVTVTDANGTGSLTNVFNTFTSTNYQVECEDYDYGGGSFVDDQQVDGFNGLAAVTDVDFHDVATGGSYVYRPTGTATDTANDAQRDQFIGHTDYIIGFYENGEWGNYTRHYPAGYYNVYLRVATGNGSTTTADLQRVISGYGTTSQTTTNLGTFTILSKGWGTYEWVQLNDISGQPAVVDLNSPTSTLRLSRPISTPGVNANFMMFVATVPPVFLAATVSGGNIHISFLTQSGSNYQVQYKNQLSDAIWNNLGSSVSGNGLTQSVSDPSTGGSRFYRVQIQ